eukprot:CAMPEP_0198580330 /NCGR_PEP_ID=MMETSP1462-20131121/122709_1 /TAXON_ID=1333877 /ORGANISM="Brandtodinium nutriculum, Strain RCC3387" /LENGTH=115 /DNA_ID=CAMNT_0044311677 /DNA_START=72 /DNA_END=416 /DNA_ORIENTATION=-
MLLQGAGQGHTGGLAEAGLPEMQPPWGGVARKRRRQGLGARVAQGHACGLAGASAREEVRPLPRKRNRRRKGPDVAKGPAAPSQRSGRRQRRARAARQSGGQSQAGGLAEARHPE